MKSNATSNVPIPTAKRGLKTYFAETGRELKKVQWPSKQETTRLTGVVLTVCTLVTFTLLLLGAGIDLIVSLITTGKL